MPNIRYIIVVLAEPLHESYATIVFLFNQISLSGCPKILQADKLVQDPLLLIEIDEMRKMDKETGVEDYTMINED